MNRLSSRRWKSVLAALAALSLPFGGLRASRAEPAEAPVGAALAETPSPAQGAKAAPPAAPSAQAAAGSAIATWLRHLSEGLSESAGPIEARADIAAVAAVRGSAQNEPSLRSPAWIGGIEARKASLLKAERLELKRAVDLGLGGNIQEALKALSAFEKEHPKSPLVPDAIKARSKLRRLGRLQGAGKKSSDAKSPQKGGR